MYACVHLLIGRPFFRSASLGDEVILPSESETGLLCCCRKLSTGVVVCVDCVDNVM